MRHCPQEYRAEPVRRYGARRAAPVPRSNRLAGGGAYRLLIPVVVIVVIVVAVVTLAAVLEGVEDRVIDHTKLTFRHNGIDRRLTDVHGHVLGDLLA